MSGLGNTARGRWLRSGLAVACVACVAGLVGCGGSSAPAESPIGGPAPVPSPTPAPATPPAVANCSNLPAVGVWQNISPPEVAEHHAAGVMVDPQLPGTAYTGFFDASNANFTGKGLWRTRDCGATWERLAQGQRIDAHAPILFAIDPTDSQVLYGIGFAETAFKSTNGGRDWTAIAPNLPGPNGTVNWVQWIGMNATDPRHLVVTMHDNCSGSIGPMCLAESLDGGSTWRGFRGPREFNGWVEGTGVAVLSRTRFLLASDLGVYHTADAGATWEKVISNSCMLSLTRGSDGLHYIGCKDGIHRSSDGGRTWTLLPGTPWTDWLIEAEGRWYGSVTNDYSGAPYRTAPASDPTRWTPLSTPYLKQGNNGFSYDAANQLLYVSSSSAGLWRVRLK